MRIIDNSLCQQRWPGQQFPSILFLADGYENVHTATIAFCVYLLNEFPTCFEKIFYTKLMTGGQLANKINDVSLEIYFLESNSRIFLRIVSDLS